MDYAESHAHVMASVNDLHIIRYDHIFAKSGHVLIRYTAEGHFKGEPYMGIQPNGNHGRWGAAAIFEVKGGKIKSFTKDWDQKVSKYFVSLHRQSLCAETYSANHAWLGSRQRE